MMTNVEKSMKHIDQAGEKMAKPEWKDFLEELREEIEMRLQCIREESENESD